MEDIKIWLRSEWERVAAGVAVALGAIALFLGYQGISGSPYVAEQLSYLISGGVGGLFLLGVGATLFLSADLHDEWRKLDELEDAIRSHRNDRAGGSSGDVTRSNGKAATFDVTDAGTDTDVVAVAAAALASRPDGRRRAGGWNAVTPVPARLLQVRGGAAALGLAAVLAITWFEASGHADAGDALGGVSRAVAVVFAAGLALACYLGLLRRGVALRSVTVVGALGAATQATALVVASHDATSDRVGGDGLVLMGRGMRRYHTGGCPMVASIPRPRRLPLPKAAASGVPCELCDAPAAPDHAAGAP